MVNYLAQYGGYCSSNGYITGSFTTDGVSTLRQHQVEVVSLFMSGRDISVSLPAGSGKSLCYCILPGVFDTIQQCSSSIVIIVSPP